MAEVRHREEAEERSELHRVIDPATDRLDGSKADLLHCSQPEITIISTEPLDNNNWFSASPVVFPTTPPSSWAAEIQAPPSYDQVIQEKTREEHIVRPTAAPRRSPDCTSTTCSTQTDPIRDKSAGKKPQKPPRTSLSRPECSSESGPHKSKERWDSGDQCTRSVTFHWKATAALDPPPRATTYSVPTIELSPVPFPRTKSRKQTEDNIQTLIKFEDDEVPADAADISSNDYLKDLLEVFSSNQDQANQEEQVHGEMNSQRNIQARIKAFESQIAPEDGSASEAIKPQPLPRKTVKPPTVSAKPPLAARSLLVQDSPNVSSQDHMPVFKPQLPQESPGKSMSEELETVLTKDGPPHRSHRAVLTRDNSIHDEEPPLPPRPPVKHTKEPLKPNLNINNHNSTTILRDDEYFDTPANPTPVKARPSVTRRPTTIRVRSQTVPESLQGNPPPLPARKPVGSPNATTIPKQRSLPSVPTQELLRNNQVQRENIRKTLPPRPPPAKLGPGRPPPPKVQATKPHKGFFLPPRPVQGHCLYEKYTIPHGSASSDLNGSRTAPRRFQADGPSYKQENGLQVQALYDFTPEGPGELGLKAGDIINMVERVDSEWYRGTCRGSTGYFPVNFVKVLSDAPANPVPETKPKPISITPSYPARDFEGESDVIRLQGNVDNEWAHSQTGATSGILIEDLPPPPVQHQSRSNPNRVTFSSPKLSNSNQFEVGGVKGRAMYDFTSDCDEELSMQVGDLIVNLESVDDDWFLGDLRGKRALVPKNYVEVL